MPRVARLDEPGMIQHVTVRGNERRSIFRDDSDRLELLARLERVLPLAGARCLAWALLPNHFHLVLQSRRIRLASAMASVNTSYALYFNRRHRRVGHLFQNRFGSRPVLDEGDLAGVILYVVGNPIKHSVIPDEEALRRHPWSGYGALVGALRPRAFHAADDALRIFGEPPERARAAARDLITRRASLWAIVNDPDAPLLSADDPGPAHLREMVRAVCQDLSVSQTDLRRGRRNRQLSEARARIAELALRKGWTLSSLAATLGVSVPALSQAARKRRERGEKLTT